MKRSRTAGLILMGTAPLLLSACSHEPDAVRSGLYTSVDACVAAGNDRSTCTDAYVSAYHESKAAAPAFTTEGECEARYGPSGCIVRSEGGHSLFMPMMAGFMLAQAMRGSQATGAFRSAAAFRDPVRGWSQAPWMDQGKQPPANGSPAAGGGGNGGGGYFRGTSGAASNPLTAVDTTPDRASTTRVSGAQARTGWMTASRGGFGSGG
ncbi:MAG TPA: DUF1190 domain-containing protein, partial [Rhodanobacter sp.]|nr:DUF1190 domain-containing protein [Rhodanobacter sp.]